MKIGVIGGSGLYDMEGMEGVHEVALETPFGKPSDAYVCGRLDGVEVVFLARHGRGHVYLPAEVNYRANIYGMKQLGVERIISVSAVGSFRDEMAPRDVVFVDQFVDRTQRGLAQTFFGDGIVAHVGFAEPICGDLRRSLYRAALRELAALPEEPDWKRRPRAFEQATYLNMEGPAFSTRAESLLYKSWGMDVIGMTNMSEARLAREAEICYCTMAMVTDYDCWHPDHDSVTVDMIVAVLRRNAATAKAIIRAAVAEAAASTECSCREALATAVITDPSLFPESTRGKLDLLLRKYFGSSQS